ncbi:HEAT repeat domain-containing protein [Brucepastera parasyntrophica]|uniref:HEAT repeat domain-containing protein n=1 Tax=Brucepastera parasyntrophica TaxID=2880008 RepID=UPI00210ADA33|nr:HEAT repeat domain-containing protein [Brucepastera parasyntrophica]ULQ60231.1 HEAT repeat domain-containing protein [Brucepastera parasyntrophica]
MSRTIENLLANSGLPGPRGNLELLYSFSKTATEKEVKECLSYYTDTLSNSPEEFVVMCGIVGTAILNAENPDLALSLIRKYASHSSWRIREAVAIAVQEISDPGNIQQIISILREWSRGNEFEQRAVVAALCEPKLLKDPATVKEVFRILDRITSGFGTVTGKLTDAQTSLRKALGYGWSVAIVALPGPGKTCLEKLAQSDNKNIRWIVKENLKKNRLAVMDKVWVEKMTGIISGEGTSM